MSTILARIQSWIERDNARSDAILASRSTRWLIARALLGAIFTAKGALLLLHTTDAWRYAVGPALMLGGLFFIIESAQTLAQRATGRRTKTVELE